jgi:hypothetical protein
MKKLLEVIDTKSAYVTCQQRLKELLDKTDFSLNFKDFCFTLQKEIRYLFIELFDDFFKERKSSSFKILHNGKKYYYPYFIAMIDVKLTDNDFGASVQFSNTPIEDTERVIMIFNLPLTVLERIYTKDDIKIRYFINRLSSTFSHELTHVEQDYKVKHLNNLNKIKAKHKQTVYYNEENKKDYYASKHEIQAYAVNAAHELVEYWGGDSKKALKYLSHPSSVKNSETLKLYFNEIKDYNINAWRYFIKNVVLQLKNY